MQYTKDPALGHVAGGYRTLAAAEANGTAFAAYMGASSTDGLRALSAVEIVSKVYAADAPSDGTDFGNVLDGYVLPTSYTEAMESGAEADVPVLTGNNKDENGASPNLKMTVAQFQAYAESEFADRAPEFLALYPAATDEEAAEQYNNYARDEERVSTFLWGTQFKETAGNRSPVYNYWWTHVPPGSDTTNPIEPTNGAGAYHGAEKYYLFGNLYGTDRPWTEADHAIADTTSSYVANFCATGNPNGRHSPPHVACPAYVEAVVDGARGRLRPRPGGGQRRQVRLSEGLLGVAADGVLTRRSVPCAGAQPSPEGAQCAARLGDGRAA